MVYVTRISQNMESKKTYGQCFVCPWRGTLVRVASASANAADPRNSGLKKKMLLILLEPFRVIVVSNDFEGL